MKKKLTEKEAEIMSILWSEGPLTVRQMLEHYDEPRPHFNTVSTTVRILEDKGFVSHETDGKAFRYFSIVDKSEYRERSLSLLIKQFFNDSYTSAVSSLVEEEKISTEDLKEIIRLIEGKDK